MSSSTSNSRHQGFGTYFVTYLVTLLPLGVLLGMNILFLDSVQELWSAKETALYQQENDFCIYGSAVHSYEVDYKILSLALRKPEVIALGSSRVLQMRETYFSSSFYNFGNTMGGINGSEELMTQLLDAHIPKVVLLGVDVWWFNDQYVLPRYEKRLDSRVALDNIKPRDLFLPTRWLWENKISFEDYFKGVFHIQKDSLCTIGAKAQEHHSGYGPDGSYYYTNIITGRTSTEAALFGDALNRIKKGNHRFEYGSKANDEHIKHFVNLIRMMEDKGIYVITFFPPFASEVLEAIEKKGEKYGYIADVKAKLSSAGVAFIDASDPQTIGSSSCEFIDGFHAGDVAFARLIDVILSDNRGAPLEEHVDRRALKKFIDNGVGMAKSRITDLPIEKEVDFLGLGCAK